MERILQIVTDTDRRGAQVFATDLHRELARQGHDVRTVALAPGTVGGLDLPTLGPSRMHPTTLRALRRELTRATVAIAHGSTTLPACALTSMGCSTPFVYRQISDSRFWAPSGLRRARVRLALTRAAAVVALWSGSADTLHQHLGVPRSKIHVVPNAVPDDRFAPASSLARAAARDRWGLDADAMVVAHVGALVPEKGVDLVIGALAEADGVQLLVVGDGVERTALESAARAVGPGRVVFAGSLADARPAYAAADAIILASRGGDSMPAVLIEAGLCGLPAVATAVEAIPEVVLDGTTGFVVAASADRVARVLRELAASPGRRTELGSAARAHCLANFAIETVAAQWSMVLDGVCRGS